MKLVLLVVGAALLAGGLSVACGPKETYCFDEGKSCEEVWRDKVRECEDLNEADMDAGRPGTRDCSEAAIPKDPTPRK